MALEKLAFNREIFQDAFELRFRILDHCWKLVEDEQCPLFHS